METCDEVAVVAPQSLSNRTAFTCLSGPTTVREIALPHVSDSWNCISAQQKNSNVANAIALQIKILRGDLITMRNPKSSFDAFQLIPVRDDMWITNTALPSTD